MERGIFEAYDSVKYAIEELKYPITELHNFFENSSDSIRNTEDANIFVFFISKHIKNLIQMAKELDDEYAKEAD